MIHPSFTVPVYLESAGAPKDRGNSERLTVFTRRGAGTGQGCKGLKGYASVLAPIRVAFLCTSTGGDFMRKLVAMIFFAMLAGNAMAQGVARRRVPVAVRPAARRVLP